MHCERNVTQISQANAKRINSAKLALIFSLHCGSRRPGVFIQLLAALVRPHYR
jgi:hypothetical protein